MKKYHKVATAKIIDCGGYHILEGLNIVDLYCIDDESLNSCEYVYVHSNNQYYGYHPSRFHLLKIDASAESLDTILGLE